MTATLCGLGGVRAVIAEHILLKQQLIVVRRPRQRAPRLTASDRLLFGFGALFLSPGRIRKVAIGVRLSVSNSLSGRHWELDQVPAVGDPTDIVQLGSGAMQRSSILDSARKLGIRDAQAAREGQSFARTATGIHRVLPAAVAQYARLGRSVAAEHAAHAGEDMSLARGAMVGGHDSCPCGSGKTYTNCCGVTVH